MASVRARTPQQNSMCMNHINLTKLFVIFLLYHSSLHCPAHVPAGCLGTDTFLQTMSVFSFLIWFAGWFP